MMLELSGVRKRYQGFQLDCSMEVREGYITALIGANGAGKSTTFKAVLDLIRPDSGEIRILGKDHRKLTEKDREELGVVLGGSMFSGYLTIEQTVKVMRNFYERFNVSWFREKCADFSLPMNKKIKEFSTGMKAKLKLLLALSYEAKFLILDEPTAGLDVLARDEMLGLLREYMETEGRSILISSHISSDLEGLCDDVYMIHQGKIVLHENTDALLDSYGLIKADPGAFAGVDKSHILRIRRESYGFSCLTDEKSFYQENYPGLVVEKGSIDEVMTMMVKGERL